MKKFVAIAAILFVVFVISASGHSIEENLTSMSVKNSREFMIGIHFCLTN